VTQFVPRVLIVDDEVSIRMALGAVLRSHLGYSVSAAADAAEALEILSANPHGFGVVIIDRNLPGMTGDELTGRVAKLSPGTPVVLMSGDTLSGMAAEGRQAMAQRGVRVLKKPFSAVELVALLREIVEPAGGSSPVGHPNERGGQPCNRAGSR
jgi:DNA-binding NtrC family response regulator